MKFLTLLLKHIDRNVLESTWQFLIKNKRVIFNTSVLLPGIYPMLYFLNNWCHGAPWEKCLQNTTIKFFRPNYLISRTVSYLIFFFTR